VSTITSVAERAQILSDALQRTTGLLQARSTPASA